MSLEKVNNFEKGSEKSKILLEELSNEISKKYWIEKQETQKLIKLDTSKWIDSLKNELRESWNIYFENLKANEQEKLFLILKWAQESIEQQTHIEVLTLKEDIEQNIDVNKIKNNIEDFLPEKLLQTAKNPKLPHEHILWFTLWTANTLVAWIDWLYQVWKWIIQSPYHIYLIIKWEAELKSSKNI